MSALEQQIGGQHYKTLTLQPLEHTYLNYGYRGLKAAVHTKVDKYMLRNKDSEVEDIAKAIHCLEILKEKAAKERMGITYPVPGEVVETGQNFNVRY